MKNSAEKRAASNSFTGSTPEALISPYEALANTDSELDSVRAQLKNYREREAPLPASAREALSQYKAAAVKRGDDVAAGAAWCLETIADAQDQYLKAWSSMQDDMFYAAWCALERGEISLHFLARHFTDQRDEYGVRFLQDHIPRWQKLFPYTLFVSPGFVSQAIHCSVCDQRLTPRNQCEHHLGDLFNGEMVSRIIKKARMLEMSLVTDPVQKYSVAFLEGRKFNYAAVHYVEQAMSSPWERWDIHRTTRRHADPKFRNIPRNAACPCGSGKKFKKCREHETHYTTPHFDIEFLDERAPASIPGESNAPYYGRDDNIEHATKLGSQGLVSASSSHCASFKPRAK